MVSPIHFEGPFLMVGHRTMKNIGPKKLERFMKKGLGV